MFLLSTLLGRADEPPAPPFCPYQITEVELGAPLHDLSRSTSEGGQQYERAFVVVRLFSQPIGTVDLPLPATGLSAAVLAEGIWQAYGGVINARLTAEGLDSIGALTPAGIIPATVPASVAAREAFLAEAPPVSIVISTRDRPTQLLRCLQAVLQVRYPCFEVIIIDNAPATPATAELFREHFLNDQRVQYVLEPIAGLSVARNRGLYETQHEIVVFIDDDVIVDQYWLAAMVQPLHTQPAVASVTGLILPYELVTPAQGWIRHFGNLNKGFQHTVFDLAKHRPSDPMFPYLTWKIGGGASIAFRVARLRAIGGFDPLLGTGSPARAGEEMSAYFQLLMNGEQIIYEPAALVYHHDYRDYAALRRQTYGYGVGLLPYLLKCLVDNPRLIPDFLYKIPAGLWQSRHLTDTLPEELAHWKPYSRDLIWVRRSGMLSSPVALLRSWLRARRLRSSLPDFTVMMTLLSSSLALCL